jgi:hypothetical protein
MCGIASVDLSRAMRRPFDRTAPRKDFLSKAAHAIKAQRFASSDAGSDSQSNAWFG